MIRRACWLAAGAVLGVLGYRKAAALARVAGPGRSRPRSHVGASASPIPRPRPGAAARLTRGAVAVAGFGRDVRDGIRL
jgi:hypothetical protein